MAEWKVKPKYAENKETLTHEKDAVLEIDSASKELEEPILSEQSSNSDLAESSGQPSQQSFDQQPVQKQTNNLSKKQETFVELENTSLPKPKRTPRAEDQLAELLKSYKRGEIEFKEFQKKKSALLVKLNPEKIKMAKTTAAPAQKKVYENYGKVARFSWPQKISMLLCLILFLLLILGFFWLQQPLPRAEQLL